MNCLMTLLCLAGLTFPDPTVAGGALATAEPPGTVAPAAQQEDTEAPAREPLVTDRPDATESADTVARGLFQIEGGYTFSHADQVDGHSFGEVLLRIGVADDLELRAGLDSYVWERASGADAKGFADTAVGLKWRLADGGGPGSGRPTVALLASTSLPTGADAVGAGGLQPELVLAGALDLDERVGIGVNVGWSWREDTDLDERFSELLASVAVGFRLSDAWGAYFEYFGAYGLDGRADEDFLNGGLTYLVNHDLQLDGRVGYGLNGLDDEIFVGLGAAVRW